MAIIVSHNRKRGSGSRIDALTNRTAQSGGSLGGNKKAGTVQFGTTWMRGNMGNYLRRVDRGCCNRGPLFAMYNTTRYPVQYKRNGYAVMHSGMLG